VLTKKAYLKEGEGPEKGERGTVGRKKTLIFKDKKTKSLGQESPFYTIRNGFTVKGDIQKGFPGKGGGSISH